MAFVIFIILIPVVILVFMINNKISSIESQLTALKKQITANAKVEVFPVIEAQIEVSPITYPEPEPVVEELIQDEPVVEEFIQEEPVVEELIQDEPQIVEPLIEEPIIEKPVPVYVPKPAKKPKNIEKYIGENLFGKIGILIFVVGVGLFVKYAIDNEWLSETMRTVLGFAMGGGLLFVAERLSKKYRMFSSLLAGGAFAIFYLTTSIAYHYYSIFSYPVAFTILIATTIAMIVLSLLYNRRELAITSLVGGFVAPFIISSGNSDYIVLFTYIAILCAAMFVLSIKKRWSELPIICFVATCLIMLIFTLTTNMNYIGGGMLGFATLFYLIFLLPVIYILRSHDKINWALLSLVVSNNFVYLAFGLYFLHTMPLSMNLDGVLTLFVAAVNLAMVMWIMRHHKDRRELVYSMLSLVLSFVSLTIPLQLEGNYITLFWATEIVVLLWLFTKSKLALYNYFALGMMVLTVVSLLIDYTHISGRAMMFINAHFVTSFYTAVCFVVAGVIIGRNRPTFDSKGALPYNPFNLITLSIGVLIAYVSVMSQFQTYLDNSSAGVGMIFTMLYLLLLLFFCGKRFAGNTLGILRFAAIGLGFLFYITQCVAIDEAILFWGATASWGALATYGACKYLKVKDLTADRFNSFVVFINAVTGVVWTIAVIEFATQLGIYQRSSEFSIALSVLGTVQMVLGMKLHIRVLRIISVVVLSIVILKLALYDLWLMNTAGKIVVFISFGAILLTLSFLYQKLKDVLFSKDED